MPILTRRRREAPPLVWRLWCAEWLALSARQTDTWWQERKATLLQASDANRETERTTFHVERRWIEAIRRQADFDHLTITQVVNEAFRRHFERP